jgi:hypothetical protein
VPRLQLNGKSIKVEAPPDMPLLRELRASRMSGTRFGGRIALCSACTAHINLHDFRIPRISDLPPVTGIQIASTAKPGGPGSSPAAGG